MSRENVSLNKSIPNIKIIKKSINQNMLNKQLINNIIPNNILEEILTREYIYNYIYGNIHRAKYLQSMFDYFDINLSPNIVMTIIYDDFWIICEKNDNTYRYKMKRKLINLINSLTKNINCISTTLIGTDKVVLLLDCAHLNKKESEEYALEIASYLCTKLKKLTGYSISVGISSYKYNTDNISIAYEESFRALENIFRIGKGKVIKFSNKENKIEHSTYSIENIIHNLLIAIGLHNLENINEIIQHFNNFLLNSNSQDSSMKSISIIFLSEITNYFTFEHNRDFMSKELVNSISNILICNTIDDIFNIILEFCINLSENIKGTNSIENGVLIAKSYIDKYYMFEITLEKISYIAGYSSSHFSRSFKKIVGLSYISYLFNKRMNEAEKLLINTTKSILEISIDVGFENLSYFSSAFKNYSGLSPTEYRYKKPY